MTQTDDSGRDRPGTDDPDGAALFRQAVADARPLDTDRIDPRSPPPSARPHQSEQDDRAVMDALLDVSPEYAAALADVETGEELLYSRPGIQRQVVRRLRRGQYPSTADLDLHGLTLREAYPEVIRFVREERERGTRCIRIVHGKGHRSAHRGPVLKGAVDQWLRRLDEVLAFASAQPRDGGTGAVYVLLRGPRR